MAFSHDDVIKAQFEMITAQLARANGEYEAARLSDDADATLEASGRIIDLNQKAAQLDRIASGYLAGQQSGPQGNPHGLTDDEMDIASISHLTPEEYAKNKRKMEVMKGQGYWQHGSMKR